MGKTTMICPSEDREENLRLLMAYYIPEIKDDNISLEISEVEDLALLFPVKLPPWKLGTMKEVISGKTIQQAAAGIPYSVSYIPTILRQLCQILTVVILPWDKIPVNYIFPPFTARKMRTQGVDFLGQLDGLSCEKIAEAIPRLSKDKAQRAYDNLLICQQMRRVFNENRHREF